MLGKAAMIAVLLAPTANIARHDDHKTGGTGDRGINGVSSPDMGRFKHGQPRTAARTFTTRASSPMMRSKKTRGRSGMKRNLACRWLAAAVLALIVGSAQAQEFPSRPMTLMV